MGSFSNYLELELLDHILGDGAYTSPTAYIALCTADPTDAGTGASMNEVANSNAYARVATDAADWNAAAAGSKDNALAITFPEATGSWGTITHFAIVDSGTHGAGNMLVHGSLSVSKTIANGDAPRFAAGDLTITLD
jgi:hypothetical protein